MFAILIDTHTDKLNVTFKFVMYGKKVFCVHNTAKFLEQVW